MIIRSATLLSSSPDLAGCAVSELPEFAFIGRSNVGKSSLVNLLTGRRELARVSATPGKTRLINLFTINKAWNLADLPGYGYAKVGKSDRAKFSTLIADFLKKRKNLRCTFVLIDTRLEPQKIDLEFLGWMVENGLPLALIFTKADKLSPTAARAGMERFLESLRTISEEDPISILSSSKLGTGRSELLDLIETSLSEEDDELEAGDEAA